MPVLSCDGLRLPAAYCVEQAGEAAPVVGDAELVEDDPIAILHAPTAKLFMHVNTYILHGGFTSCASAPGGNHPSALVGGMWIAAQPRPSQKTDLIRVMVWAGQPMHPLHLRRHHKRSFSYRQRRGNETQSVPK
ncbi:MAG: hypothetical protein Q6352_019440, partial [Candidatus Freyrarchaeum guaymaensis]